MWEVLGAAAGGLGLNWLVNKLFGNNELQKELEKVAKQGILSPAERNLFYRQLRDQVIGSAGTATRMGQAITGARGLDTGLSSALTRDIASGIAGQTSQAMSELEKANIATRLQGLGMWNQYQQYLAQAMAQMFGGLGQAAGMAIGAM